jgi:hypothetical protein
MSCEEDPARERDNAFDLILTTAVRPAAFRDGQGGTGVGAEADGSPRPQNRLSSRTYIP